MNEIADGLKWRPCFSTLVTIRTELSEFVSYVNAGNDFTFRH